MLRLLRPAKLITILTISLIFIFAFTTIVGASHFSSSRVLSETDATPSALKAVKKEERKTLLKEKLDAKRLRVCERVEAKIKKRSVRMVTRAENMVTRFDKIAGKVEDYYTDKLLPKGGKIDNYESLVADVAAHEAAVNDAIATAKSGISSFDCGANDPKGQLDNFRVDMKAVITALKDYRKSVVNLLVAVRTKAKNIRTFEATGSSEPATNSANN